MSFAKGVTTGYLPLGGVIISKHMHEVLLDAPADEKFMHAATYSGHPVCCAVALANIDIIEKGKPGRARPGPGRPLPPRPGIAAHACQCRRGPRHRHARRDRTGRGQGQQGAGEGPGCQGRRRGSQSRHDHARARARPMAPRPAATRWSSPRRCPRPKRRWTASSKSSETRSRRWLRAAGVRRSCARTPVRRNRQPSQALLSRSAWGRPAPICHCEEPSDEAISEFHRLADRDSSVASLHAMNRPTRLPCVSPVGTHAGHWHRRPLTYLRLQSQPCRRSCTPQPTQSHRPPVAISTSRMSISGWPNRSPRWLTAISVGSIARTSLNISPIRRSATVGNFARG